MPVYKNTRTGVEFFTPCECRGADIEPVPAAPAPSPAPAEEAPKARKPRSKSK